MSHPTPRPDLDATAADGQALADTLTPAQLASLDGRLLRFLQRAEAIRTRHQIAGVLELGKAALDELFDGDLGRVHDRAAARALPLTRLVEQHAQRLDYLGLDAGRIRSAIAAFEVNARLPAHLDGRLSPGHLRALAPLPGPELLQLASMAHDDRWSVDHTAAKVATLRSERGLAGRGGPKPKPPVVLRAAAMLRASQQLGTPGDLSVLQLGDRVALRRAMTQLRDQAEAWLLALEQ